MARISHVDDAYLFNRMIVHDQFAVFFKVVFALATLATVWMSLGSKEVQRTSQGEYYGILLASALGMYFMASASNLLMAYLSLEFVSLTSYVLTGSLRHNRRSGEASLKYLIYGGVASGRDDLRHELDLRPHRQHGLRRDQRTRWPTGRSNPLALFIAIVLVLAGFGYKISAVPFHMWAPDVYTGAPIPITAFLSVGSKAAGFALLLRFFYPGAVDARRGGALAGARRASTGRSSCWCSAASP